MSTSHVAIVAANDAPPALRNTRAAHATPITRPLDRSSTIDASLKEPGPDSTMAYLRRMASDHALWLAFFVLLVLARWSLAGLVRDERHRSRLVTSS